jgi:hypothetical protein
LYFMLRGFNFIVIVLSLFSNKNKFSFKIKSIDQ